MNGIIFPWIQYISLSSVCSCVLIDFLSEKKIHVRAMASQTRENKSIADQLADDRNVNILNSNSVCMSPTKESLVYHTINYYLIESHTNRNGNEIIYNSGINYEKFSVLFSVSNNYEAIFSISHLSADISTYDEVIDNQFFLPTNDRSRQFSIWSTKKNQLTGELW